MKIRCLIVDDEPLAREGLQQYVAEIDFLECVGTAANPLEAIPLIDATQPELLFLDIEMPKLNGLDFIRSLRQPPLIVLTTAYPQYAIEGFALEVLDYLVKPITMDRFLQASLRARRRLASTPLPSLPTTDEVTETIDHFFVKVDGRIERIQLHEFLFAQAMQNYIHLFTLRGRFTTLLSLRELEESINNTDVVRVHKSYLVYLQQVNTLDGHVLVIHDHRIPVARRRWAEVEAKFLEGGNLLGH